jgi:hypothetical protein
MSGPMPTRGPGWTLPGATEQIQDQMFGGPMGLPNMDFGRGQLSAFLEQSPEDRSRRIPKSLGGIDLGDEEKKQIGLGRQVLDAMYGTDTSKMTTPAMIIGALQALGTGFNTFANAHWDKTPGGGQVTGPSALGALQAYGQQSGEVADEREKDDFIDSMIANAKTDKEKDHWQAIKVGAKPFEDTEAVWKARREWEREQEAVRDARESKQAAAVRQEGWRTSPPKSVRKPGGWGTARRNPDTGVYEDTGEPLVPYPKGAGDVPGRQTRAKKEEIELALREGPISKNDAWWYAIQQNHEDPDKIMMAIEEYLKERFGVEDPWSLSVGEGAAPAEVKKPEKGDRKSKGGRSMVFDGENWRWED